MNAKLEFAVTSVTMIERKWKRFPSREVGAELFANLNYRVVSASFSEGTSDLVVVTQYDIRLTNQPTEQEIEQQEELETDIGRIGSNFMVTLESTRAITNEDAEAGLLNSAQDLANEISHHYHRREIQAMSREMGLPEYLIAVTFPEAKMTLAQAAL